MRLALVLPPLTQLNTPYPATAYLHRSLRGAPIEVTQRDLGLELVLRLFSRSGLKQIFDALETQDALPDPAWRALALRGQHEAVVEPVLRFLQGKDRTLAPRILDTPFLPRGPRLDEAALDAFGRMGNEDAARHLATLYLADLADLVTSTIDEGFALARYNHHLAVSPAPFAPIAARLGETTLVDAHLDALTDTLDAEIVGLSVPFPGNLYGALRVGRRLRARGVTVLMGGGYVSTELRAVEEPQLWDCVDALIYDDGEGPLRAILEHAAGGPDRRHRTRTRAGLHTNPAPVAATTFAADYGDLRLDRYLNLVDTLNPAHRLWADGRWSKITLAHGCYWRRCAFCDVQLDYIARFEAADAKKLADAMDELAEKTGQGGFHFVDEAAPPRVMKALALELLARQRPYTWWGNIRFERSFTPDLCRLLAASGLVSVTGGLEVASDRLLALMDKGVTVEQVARAAASFRAAGVMVHAYLMYGFPTQTDQETIDSMELVRQLFAPGAISSAFWHRFVLTRHSRIAPDPGRWGVEIVAREAGFADNDLVHRDPSGGAHDRFDLVLPQALERWMQQEELDRPVHTWFQDAMPPTTEPADRIARALRLVENPLGERLVWLGGDVLDGGDALWLHHNGGEARVRGPRKALDWLSELLTAAAPGASPVLREEAIAAFPGNFSRFSRAFATARRAGLVGV